ncbi:MAG: iron ABC transporter permease [Betaproteobacteria bacterium RIFCSPLOWO2_02_FULL_65_24]|nr:MAG: iron ABC transporter permease [Betaproteobacteria bacterium RIFCSPLOWO2_02_FULL_65_24]
MTLPAAVPAFALRGPRSAAGLAIASIAVAAVLVFPIVVVLSSSLAPGRGTWQHLASTVLPDYIVSTLLLVCGVAVGVILLGVSSAWLVTTYRFPGRKVLEWALVLPFAVPGYVVAYAYTDFLQFSGPVQSTLRSLAGWQAGQYWFPDIRSLGGAGVVFSLVLYPYVYLLARAAFLEQSANLIEAGRLLGRGAWGTFFLVALPLARPAIAAGTSLALMETLADFGTVSYFSVQTFTTGIYRAWLSMGDTVAAAQLSATLLAVVFAILLLERWNRGQARYYNAFTRSHEHLHRLSKRSSAAAILVCAAPPTLGFVLPAMILIHRVATEPEPLFDQRFVSLAANSFTLAGITALAAVGLALLLAYAARITRWRPVGVANRLASLGYAMPGAVIAVGILVPVARLDNWLAAWIEARFGMNIGLLFTGSVIALIYAYLVRFLAIALQTVEAGLGKIRPSMEDAARSLGHGPASMLMRVHAPIMWSSLLTAGLIVFVDVMKELPATFAMRPFNFDTLAVQAYHYASDERLAQAASASLVIVAVSLVPVILLSRAIAKK